MTLESRSSSFRARTCPRLYYSRAGQVPRLNGPLIGFIGMKKAFPVLFAFLCFGMARAQEIDVTRLDKIGPVTSFVKIET